MTHFRELDIVRLLKAERHISGLKSVMRQPRVGDRGTVVHIPQFEPEQVLIVECVHSSGAAIWAADFTPEEVEKIPQETINTETHD
jgi:hypothetical protein